MLDAGVLIGFLDADDAHHADAVKVITKSLRAGTEFVVSTLTLAEALVLPTRLGVDQFRLARTAISAVTGGRYAPLDEQVALHLAAIRAADRSLKVPDATVVATARAVGARRIVTTDRRLARDEAAVMLSRAAAQV